jgi:hypothetical protein
MRVLLEIRLVREELPEPEVELVVVLTGKPSLKFYK